MSDLSQPLAPLSARWVKLRPHPAGEAYSLSPHRFNTVAAGRRSGKTERAKRKLVRRALSAATDWVPRFFAGAPTRDQAKRIFWDDLKALLGADLMRRPPSESELILYALNGAEVHVVGLDKPQRIEGSPWDGGILTEVPNQKATAWGANIRPALSDRKGWCDLEGVPEGRNHFYDQVTQAEQLMKELGAASEWGHYSWPSSDVLDAAEIEAARRDLDELTYRQEYEASFVNFEGRIYYTFDRGTHTAPLTYNPKLPLILMFDFNTSPGVCAVGQEQRLPGQFEHDAQGAPLLNAPVTGTGIIGEVHIPRNSTTPAVCKRLAQDWGKHEGPVQCYGDATGGAGGSAKVEGSDWVLIEKNLRPVFSDRLSFHVKESNPAERARVNSVNSRLLSTVGDIRLMVDLRRAPNVVKDFEGVQALKGGSGEIDKATTPALTHLSDGIGYYVEHRFPVRGPGLIRLGVSGV